MKQDGLSVWSYLEHFGVFLSRKQLHRPSIQEMNQMSGELASPAPAALRCPVTPVEPTVRSSAQSAGRRCSLEAGGRKRGGHHWRWLSRQNSFPSTEPSSSLEVDPPCALGWARHLLGVLFLRLLPDFSLRLWEPRVHLKFSPSALSWSLTLTNKYCGSSHSWSYCSGNSCRRDGLPGGQLSAVVCVMEPFEL